MSCAEDQRHPGQAPDTNPELLRRALLIDLKMDHRAALGEDPGPQRYAGTSFVTHNGARILKDT